MKNLVRLLLILALCMSTAEWISIEEILGKQDVELALEKGEESIKELEESFLFTPFVPTHHFEFLNPVLTGFATVDFDYDEVPDSFPPLYITYCRLKTDC